MIINYYNYYLCLTLTYRIIELDTQNQTKTQSTETNQNKSESYSLYLNIISSMVKKRYQYVSLQANTNFNIITLLLCIDET